MQDSGDQIAAIGTNPHSGDVSKTTTFSAGSPAFSLPSETFELDISFEVANVNLTSTSPIGSSIFSLNLDSSLSDWLNKFQFFSIKNLQLDMQCTSPLGTSSGAILVSYMSDPINADVPTDPVESKNKFGVTFPRVIIRPRDNKCLTVDVSQNPMFGNWRCVKKASSDDISSIRQSCFGTIIAIVNSQPAASDGANFTTWIHGTLVAKGRSMVTDNALSRKAPYIISVIGKSQLIQDELGYAITLSMESCSGDNGVSVLDLTYGMHKKGIWPVAIADSNFTLSVTLKDGDETQEIELQSPIMYISAIWKAPSGYNQPVMYIPFPSHEEVFLMNPSLSEVSSINNIHVSVYLTDFSDTRSSRNVAPISKRRMFLKKGTQRTCEL